MHLDGKCVLLSALLNRGFPCVNIIIMYIYTTLRMQEPLTQPPALLLAHIFTLLLKIIS